MPTSYVELMEAVNRLNITVNGDASRDKKGLVERVNNHEDFIKEQRDMFRKILWAAVLGALGTLGNYFLNLKSISTQQQPQVIHTTQPK